MHSEENEARRGGLDRPDDPGLVRRWLGDGEFHRSLALQVVSGLIIALILAAIGFGVHELRGDDGHPVVGQVQVTAPEPTEAPKASAPDVQSVLVENVAAHGMQALLLLGPLSCFLLAFGVLLRGRTGPTSETTKPSLTKNVNAR